MISNFSRKIAYNSKPILIELLMNEKKDLVLF